MIVILEGCNGVGKSAYAAALASYLDAPVLRPFRPSPDHHWNGRTPLEGLLRHLGVPINTHVDDLYIADILGQLGPLAPRDVVLDRSVPSAIAYGSAGSDPGGLYDYWQSQLRGLSHVVYVWLVCPWELARERADGRWFPGLESYQRLENSFDGLFEEFAGDKLIIDTKATGFIEEGVERILNAYPR